MSQDARFEDGAETPLNLGAQDEEGLKIPSALVQDGVFPSSEMRFVAAEQRFAGAFAVQGDEFVPFRPLGLFDPGLQILGVDGGVLVKVFGVANLTFCTNQM